MVDVQKGIIAGVIGLGRTWQLLYDIDGNGLGVVDFDCAPFARFYKRTTGRDLYQGAARERGEEYVARRLKGLRISVEGERPTQHVRLEDD